MFTFCLRNVYILHEIKQKHKQTLESAQYILEIIFKHDLIAWVVCNPGAGLSTGFFKGLGGHSVLK